MVLVKRIWYGMYLQTRPEARRTFKTAASPGRLHLEDTLRSLQEYVILYLFFKCRSRIDVKAEKKDFPL